MCGTCGCSCNLGRRGVAYVEGPENPKFHTAPKSGHSVNPSKRFIAAEIEVAGVDQTTEDDVVSPVVKKWEGAIVRDGSLPDTGFEINTAPANGDLYIQQIKEITDSIAQKKGFVNNQCGLHVHIDARDFTYYDIRKLVILYAKIEDALYSIVAKSRKESQYCIPCGKKLVRNLDKNLIPKDNEKQIIKNIYGDTYENTRNVRHDKYNQSRYNALNLHSWVYRGTIECRMHHGTINFNKIKNWGILWAGILDYAYENTEADLKALKGDPMNILLEICPTEEVQQWVIARKMFFDGQSA